MGISPWVMVSSRFDIRAARLTPVAFAWASSAAYVAGVNRSLSISFMSPCVCFHFPKTTKPRADQRLLSKLDHAGGVFVRGVINLPELINSVNR